MNERRRALTGLALGVLVVLALGVFFWRAGEAAAPSATASPPAGVQMPTPEAALVGGVARTPEQLAACRAEERRRAAQEPWQPVAPPAQPVRLRSEPKDLTIEDCHEMVRRWNFYSSDNPEGCFVNAYRVPQDGIVTDLATGLTWQSTPMMRPLVFSEIDAYLEKLNRERLGGFSDWRLPTLEEAFSLMESLPMGDTHADSLFFATRKEWWTSDFLTAHKARWVMFAAGADCLLLPQEINPAHHVRAVRSSP